MRFTISAPPHKKTGLTVKNIMWSKVFALIPVSIISIYFFGLPALWILFASVLAAVLAEYSIQKTFDQKITIRDGNAVLIGLMLALIIPPEAPFWIPIVGAAFAVIIGKHAFGGLGSYLFHPVLAAWIFLMIAWSEHMTPASFPYADQITDIFLENAAGFLVEVSPIALIGGVYLILRRYLDWRIPLTFTFTIVLLALIFGENLEYLVTGVLIFGILFIATDPSTSPVTKQGRIYYGILCGLLTFIYGYFSVNYGYAALYGIFLANCVTAFLERITFPKEYGTPSIFEKSYITLKEKISNRGIK
ncbi:Rnf electron transport complex subunit RnfD [Methanosalsum natronophilum]|uniref:NADH:ubiquinone oxidoreductase n=1 Tax=Methanosalsum natronophilum TaxID=768733 RepID=A0A3R7YJD2_9EURY|nr:Rnf electron transport complex subunit RnfD [Methanosalsum natronophilum]MCS3923098.1 electron transport complex protein RnfD [Methanosalsum natronophilum]RQD90109.1 MAG: NADH:ubiquinone oxidoreductase [Methanosalsum natronophilum]